MDVITLSILLEFLYNKFMVTFILCFIGSITREAFNAIKMSRMNIKKLLASTIVASFILCAVLDYVEIPFSIYTVICIVCGIWSQSVLKTIMHTKFITLCLGRILKKIKEPLIEELSDVIEEMNEDEKKDAVSDKQKSENDNEDKKT